MAFVATVLVAAIVAACAGDAGPARIPLGNLAGRQAAADALSTSSLAPTTFVLADGVDLPAGEAGAWRWDAPDLDEVAALAARLGVEGTPVEVPTDEGGGWRVGDLDMAASLTVAPNGSWWGSSGGVRSLVTSSDCDGSVIVSTEPSQVSGGPDVTVVDGADACEPTASDPPPPLPTDAEVVAAASAIFGEATEVGVDWRDEWYVSASVEYLVDGAPSGQMGSYGIDAVGWNAGGLLGTPTAQGPYPTISAADALTRLAGSPLGSGLGIPAEPGVIVASSSTGSSSGAGGVPVPETQGVGTVTAMEPSTGAPPVEDPTLDPVKPDTLPVEPLPVDPDPLPVPVPVPVEVVLVDVRVALVAFFDGTGAAWSLPGYVYTDADGGEWEVVAVSDESFDLSPEVPDDVAVDPPVDGDAPVSDVPGGEGPGDDGDPGGGVVEPFPGDTSAGGDDAGRSMTPPDVAGLPEAEATDVLEDAGFSVRVAERDGEPFMLTKDYRIDRVNLVVTGGVVTSVWVG